ncbi:TetR family transcriptional regulator [Nocardia sp. NPDC050712]|uniref:TetR/AcrR family transcriptional regulator n=1 Tax=Nocardia sp. NPDC050712 TaxID=3155518 RepID=UPI0033D2DBF0
MVRESELIRPARGTRPANRRQQIIAAATELFTQRGYAEVNMGDIAGAVAIGPSALYRHFRGKQEMLAVVIDNELAQLTEVVAACAADPDRDVAAALAAAMLDHRGVGMLWRREARNLRPDDGAAFRATARRMAGLLATAVRARRPELGTARSDLLAWCAMAAANSVSFHSLALPDAEFTGLLAHLIALVLDADIAAPDTAAGAAPAPSGLSIQSRRELILIHALPLFARKGFTAVSVDDIGAAIGITGSSVYNHFETKADILAAAIVRGDEWLRIDMHRTFARAATPRAALSGLLAGYCGLALDNPRLMQILISETGHLPEPHRHRARAAQHTYISEWTHLLHQIHPDWEATGTRIRVQAVFTMINDAGVTPHGWHRHDLETALTRIGSDILALGGP